LECNFGTFPLEEEALFESLKNSVVVDLDYDEFVGLDKEAKAMKRHEIFDKKKLEKLDETKKKSEENQKKRLVVVVEKEQEKVKKGGKKKKPKIPGPEPAYSVEDVPEGSFGFSLTQEHLVQGMTASTKNLPPVVDIDECIFNLSLGI